MENNNTEMRNLEVILEDNEIPRIGDRAPRFTANSTEGQIKLSDYIGKWLILFSHPGDFTPVCTTEFLAFSQMNAEFQKRNCELLGLSVDSNPSHLSWIHNIHRMTGMKITFPIIADSDMKISKKYGMIAPNISSTKTIRSVFFIDPNQNIRAILQYPMTSGRNIAEILRLLDSLQITDKENVMTPANWVPGQPCLMPPPTTYDDLMNKISDPNSKHCIDWYLCFNKEFNPMPYFDNSSNIQTLDIMNMNNNCNNCHMSNNFMYKK